MGISSPKVVWIRQYRGLAKSVRGVCQNWPSLNVALVPTLCLSIIEDPPPQQGIHYQPSRKDVASYQPLRCIFSTSVWICRVPSYAVHRCRPFRSLCCLGGVTSICRDEPCSFILVPLPAPLRLTTKARHLSCGQILAQFGPLEVRCIEHVVRQVQILCLCFLQRGS